MADDNKPDPAKDDNKPDPTLGDAGKKALDGERKARRDAEKKVTDLEARLKEIEDKDKSEVQKLTDEVAALRKTATDHETKALRAEVAMAKGLSAAQAKRLVGTTKEELEADADEVLEAFPTPGGAATAPPGKKPVPDLRGGTEPNTDPEETDPAKLAESVPRV